MKRRGSQILSLSEELLAVDKCWGMESQASDVVVVLLLFLGGLASKKLFVMA